MARIWGVIRQSRTEDDTTSIAAQREKITRYADLYGHTIAGWAIDESTSGNKVSPFKREKLGAALKSPNNWDMLVSAKLDRIGRNVADFAELVRWCSERGKSIACVSEGFDLSTPTGRMTAQVLMAFAEFEWERIRERRLETVEQLRQSERWGGGHIPFGYMKVKTPSGWYLRQDPERAGDVRRMVAWYQDGDGYQAIADKLNADGVIGSRGIKWGSETVRKFLCSDNLRGVKTSKGSMVRDSNGDPVRFTADPILSSGEFARLQAIIADRSIARKTPRVNGHMLLRVAFCRTDGPDAPLYALKKASRSQGGYYRCRSECGAHHPLRALEESVARIVLGAVGDDALTRRETVAGDDHAKSIAKVRADLNQVRAIRTVDMSAAVGALEAEVKRLEDLPHEADRIVWTATGETVREHWERLDDSARGQFLRDWDVKVWVDREGARVELGWLDPEARKDGSFRLA